MPKLLELRAPGMNRDFFGWKRAPSLLACSLGDCAVRCRDSGRRNARSRATKSRAAQAWHACPGTRSGGPWLDGFHGDPVHVSSLPCSRITSTCCRTRANDAGRGRITPHVRVKHVISKLFKARTPTEFLIWCIEPPSFNAGCDEKG